MCWIIDHEWGGFDGFCADQRESGQSRVIRVLVSSVVQKMSFTSLGEFAQTVSPTLLDH